MSLKDVTKRLAETVDHAVVPAKKPRNPNWTIAEERALVEAIILHYDTLFGALSNKETDEVKQGLWSSVVVKINACGICHRDLSVVKKKWFDYKSSTKKKAVKIVRERKKTGGGEADFPDMNAVEKVLEGVIQMQELKVVKLIGLEGLQGISGGIDSAVKKKEPSSDLQLVPWTEQQESNHEEELETDSTQPMTEKVTEKTDKDETLKTPSMQSKINVGKDMLSVQEKILEGVQSIANSMKELVVLQKLKLNISPSIDLTLPVIIADDPVTDNE